MDLASPVIDAFGRSFNTGMEVGARGIMGRRAEQEKTGLDLSDPDQAAEYRKRIAGESAADQRLKAAHANYYEKAAPRGGARDDRLQRLVQMGQMLGNKLSRTPEEDALYQAIQGDFADKEGIDVQPPAPPPPGFFSRVGSYLGKLSGSSNSAKAAPAAPSWNKYIK